MRFGQFLTESRGRDDLKMTDVSRSQMKKIEEWLESEGLEWTKAERQRNGKYTLYFDDVVSLSYAQDMGA